ncbi:MAG: NAD-dependent epimerase/dehydratase family protein [Halieaceae bacterium]
MKRRNVIKGLGALGTLSALPGLAGAVGKGGGQLQVLFMGGTGFIGPHMVQALLDQGHAVTLFNRGKSSPGLFDNLERIKGDRLSDDIEQLRGRSWDVVIDTSCYVPRAVTRLMSVLDHSSLQQYVFISTISVYADFSRPGITEDSPTATMPDPSSEDVNAWYGALKVLCEDAANEALPGKVTAIRCGLIVGPRDHTDRFTYWPERVFRGGDVLAPGTVASPLQTLDARDLAQWVAHCVRQQVMGTFNATNNSGNTFGDLLTLSQQELNPAAQLSWVPDDFLLEQGLQQMSDLPFWAAATGPYAGVWQVNADKATAAGLRHRPLRDTIIDTHEWIQAQPATRREPLRAGIPAQRESEVLAAWHAKSG